jgi:translation machinery-associated protein 16
MRDDRLVRVASARRKNDQPLGMFTCIYISSLLILSVVRAAYFQEAIRSNDGKPLELGAVQDLISEYKPPLDYIDALP